MAQLLVLFLCIAAKRTPSKRRLGKAILQTIHLQNVCVGHYLECRIVFQTVRQ